MANMFAEEKKYPDNTERKNVVFLAYPYTPHIGKAEYAKLVKELEKELPIRFWYFLDEVTTAELMRKIWRAILRSDLSIYDASDGNPNVAFELGLAVATGKRCMTVVKASAKNPLASADLGYAERIEYTDAAMLKEKLRAFVVAQSSALKLIKDLSYTLAAVPDAKLLQTELQERVTKLVQHVFNSKQIVKGVATKIMGDDTLATQALSRLREKNVLKVEGRNKGARYVFTDEWVYHDHQVSGE